MPTLIRLIIALLFLAGLAYGGMVALVTLVEPEQREVTVRIPARDLLGDEAAAPGGAGPGLPTPNVGGDEE